MLSTEKNNKLWNVFFENIIKLGPKYNNGLPRGGNNNNKKYHSMRYIARAKKSFVQG